MKVQVPYSTAQRVQPFDDAVAVLVVVPVLDVCVVVVDGDVVADDGEAVVSVAACASEVSEVTVSTDAPFWSARAFDAAAAASALWTNSAPPEREDCASGVALLEPPPPHAASSTAAQAHVSADIEKR